MVKFDRNTFKKNIIPILLMFSFFCALLIVNLFLEKGGFKISKLKDGDIDVSKLVINEIMSSNKGAHVDEDGNSYDWIELYNGSNHDINLHNYGLSDVESGQIKWKFPEVTIKSKEYLIVYLSGNNNAGLYANFALRKSGNDLLTLKKPNGKVVDSVRTESLAKNTVMARDSKGKWIVTDEITPGYSNNEDGRKKYLASLHSDENTDLVITEFLPRNAGNFIVKETFPGFIEIQNKGTEDIHLKDYFLSNDSNVPFMWSLPNKVLKPNEVYVAYTSQIDGFVSTDFRLKNRSGAVVLSYKNKIVDMVEYNNLAKGYAYINIDGSFVEGTYISPGYENTNDGIINFMKEKNSNPKDLMIAEVMNSNRQFMSHNGGEYYSWIALYNNSNTTVNLSDYTLTTDEESKNMYALENKQLKPGEFYILMASGNPKLGNATYKHTNFKLSKTESLYLYKKGKIIDSMYISDIPIGYSYGRNNSHGFYYFSVPTPGKINSGGRVGISSVPVASIAPGVHNNVNNLSIELKGSGTIYYTLDGSEPTRNSKVYNGPIILAKTTVIRAIHYEDGRQPSNFFTASYIINENHTLPVMSISLNHSAFREVYTAGGNNTIRKAHAELYEADGSFSIDCGIRLFGGSTRWLPKRSYALKFSKRFGPGTLNYKVFDKRDAVNWDTLVLRSGSQDNVNSMIRDELATSIMDDYGTVAVQAYKPIILYINGEYWGIYYIREFVDDEYIEHRYNVDGSKANIVRVDGNVRSGTIADYRHLTNYIRNNDMSQSRHYEYVKTKLDIENYIDFWAGQHYTTNNDLINMRFYSHPDVADGKIRMVFYDFDWAFYNWSSNHMNFMLNPAGSGSWNIDNSIIRGLMRNAEFRQTFLERFAWNMNNVWTDENLMKRYDELIKVIEPEMPRNQKRWNNTMERWNTERERLKTYLLRRRGFMLQHIQNYYGLSNAEMRRYFE